jgi:hypothetical protein
MNAQALMQTAGTLVAGAKGARCGPPALTAPKDAPLADLSMGDSQTIELNVDPDGALVTLAASSWYVCFVPGLDKQWWHPLVNKRHKHVFAIRPAAPGEWTLLEPWWHRLLSATITSMQAKKFLLWGARGDVLLVRESIPGRASQIRGWMNCAALVGYLLGRPYWVWSPHGLYKLLVREPGVCRVDVSALLEFGVDKLAAGSRVIAAHAACDACAPGSPKPPGTAKPFCMKCGRDL